MLKLLNFSCSRCLFPSDHSDHFLVNINSYSLTSASGLALDDWGLRTAEGSAVGLHEPNAGAAQTWLLADAAFISPATILTKFI